jgi:PAS domain S-box-containing protein
MVVDGLKTFDGSTRLEGQDKNFFLSGIGMWSLRLDQEKVEEAVMSLSGSFLALMGGEQGSPGPLTLRDYVRLWVHPDELSVFLGGLDDLVQGRNDHLQLEQRLWSHKRREWRWVSFDCQLSRPGQKPQSLEAIIQDIHNNRLARTALSNALMEKEEASEALGLEQQRLSAVIDAANLALWDYEVPTSQVTYSPRFAATVGCQIEELGHSLEDRKRFVPAKDLEGSLKALSGHLEGRTPFYECDYKIIRKDGEVIWAQDRGRVVEWDKEGKPKRVLGVMINVTRQKLIEQDLSHSKEQMALFFRAASFGAWDWNIATDTVEYNDIFHEMMGYKRGELNGSIVEWADMVHPDDQPASHAAMEMALNGQMPVYACEVRLKRKDGQYLWTYDIGRVVERDEDGQAKRMVGGHFDFTEKKKMEQDIFKMIEQERNARLAQQLAEESARAKSEFLANMSHEIRTPMNAILGLTHLVLQTDLGEQQQEYLGRISVAAKALLRIINDILDFSKIEAGKLEMEVTEFDLEQLLQSSLKLFLNQAQTKGVSIGYDLTPDVPRDLLGDQVRLGQILNNLLSNALKFTEKGGVEVKVRLEEKTEEEAHLIFRVSDTGIGLSEEQLKTLFTAFTQADSSITRKYGGTGLGLTISKRLSEMMGGRIWCESVPGQGSVFSFTVRMKIGKNLERKLRYTDFSFRGLTALAVDDNPTALEIIKDALKKESLEVTTVTSGDEALRYLKMVERKPDLILVDWKMPGMDGLETIRQINADSNLKESSVIIMVTAYNRDEILGRAKDVGVKKVLTKPISASYLHDSLMEIFGHKKKIKRHDASEGVEELKKIKGSNILLVEDNDVNQLVAGKILGNAGMKVTIASDGQKAVDMVRANSFDLVLMDIQMPVMDGLTASRLIREEGYADLPIVAMTAHAMSSDRELRLQAGMNDHVNKPINVTELFQTLVKWIKPKEEEAKEETAKDEKGAS